MISGVSLEGWSTVARAKRTLAKIQAIPLQRDKSFWDIPHTSFHSYQFILRTTEQPNGMRHPLLGGTRQRHFNRTSFSHANCLTGLGALPRVGCIIIPVLVRDAVLGALIECQSCQLEQA